MYGFDSQRSKIIQEAKGYGVVIKLVNDGKKFGSLQFNGSYTGSDSVKKALKRKMSTYNEHSEKGF